ncbi:helix-turn-helix transcriptional regulator [Solicola gregarius]|uniref:Helix-turn-helix transcriptional regulator n=1 Tax=Solicola gregarius TaxID=2908642 RepID=A0AA46TIM1_9ACTN|nr:helix-turn-helix transcriptional regulator [Solicola gregarius]UYM05825.1 helix-turn-helix transcriptional regulator [Solicola gregarius]
MSPRRSELGDALRNWRDRLSPEAVGVSTYGQRRATGLRREELASLSGLSVDYVTRLEQGRSSNPSAQVLTALARSLQLSRDERDHLYVLAGQAPPRSGVIDAHLTPGVQRLLARLEEFPVGVHDPAWNIVAWNPLWEALVGEAAGATVRDRNIAWRHFTGAAGRVVVDADAWIAMEGTIVADLRASRAQYPNDDGLATLIADLRSVSARFDELWQSNEVSTHVAARKSFDHPSVGRITLDCDVLTVHDSDLRIVAYTAEPGSADAQKLDLLRVVGTQRLSG